MMEEQRFAGQLIRVLRLERNWSQETLCHGICAVSYLSKIEQGKVCANRQLLEELLGRLGVKWQDSEQIIVLRDALYEGIFSWNDTYFRQQIKILDENWDRWTISSCYVDFLVIRAYYSRNPEYVPKELEVLLDGRQKALLAITQNRQDDAFRIYPCPLTAFCVGEEAYRNGNYTLALEYLQITCDQAAREGYVYLLMYGQHYMANCYSDMGNLDAMYRHGKIATRLGIALGEQELVNTVNYNIAATKVQLEDYVGAYTYFSNLESPGVMELHKLAVCCEALGKKEEAISALDKADQIEHHTDMEKQICTLVRYRLEHPDYLQDSVYGELLMNTFDRLRKELHSGYARFHLKWVCEWLTASRQYRKAYEIMCSFPDRCI